MTYLAASSTSPFQTMGPVSVGASLSGDEISDAVLRRLSSEDLGLSVYVDMIGCGNILLECKYLC
jgi:hypothetical protein